jgi:hypothetical protein
VVADVTQAEEPRIENLVLQIETPVGGVREVIVGVVAAEDVGSGASDHLRLIGELAGEDGGIAGGCGRGAAKGVG